MDWWGCDPIFAGATRCFSDPKWILADPFRALEGTGRAGLGAQGGKVRPAATRQATKQGANGDFERR